MRKLYVHDPRTGRSQRQDIKRVIAVFPRRARVYGRIRFRLIPTSFLDAIEQHLPRAGRVLDLGCGFGMFTLYFALRRPECHFIASDLNESRIEMARAAAKRLGISNVEFVAQDLADSPPSAPADAAYCMDLLHHILPEASERLLTTVYRLLGQNGVFIIKDLTTNPLPFLWLAYLQDVVMYPKDNLSYRSAEGWRAILQRIGFVETSWYPIGNFSPYPHFIAVAYKGDQIAAAT